MYNTEFTRALHLFLSSARPIQPTSPYPTSTRFILILSNHLRLALPSGLLPSGFPTNNLYAFLFPSIRATCPANPPSHPPRLHYSRGRLLTPCLPSLGCHHHQIWNDVNGLWGWNLLLHVIIKDKDKKDKSYFPFLNHRKACKLKITPTLYYRVFQEESAKVDTNFVDKWRSLGRCNSLAD
jgi:hypothetical protein